MLKLKRVSVAAPATSANLGAGFDSLALGLDFWNNLTVESAPQFSVYCCDSPECTMPLSKENLCVVGLEAVFNHLGVDVPPLKYALKQNIPLGRGMGSSAAAIVCGIAAGLSMLGREIPPEEKLNIAAGIEGHADNVAAALFGGGVVVIKGGEGYIADTINIPPNLSCVCFIPELSSDTRTSRRALPEKVPLADAAHNIGRAALMVNLLNKGRFDLMHLAVRDKLHQPYRMPELGWKFVMESAMRAGAKGVYLSGAGPAIVALATEHEVTIRYEMADALRVAGIKGEVKIVQIARKGVFVSDAK